MTKTPLPIRREKKVPHVMKHVMVEEWYSEEPEGVFQWWRFPNGDIIKRITPFEESPVIVLDKKWGEMECK